MILAYKKLGQTPLDVVRELRKKNDVTLSYAGRLDPMAEGLLLILEGEENKRRREYERLDKEYEFEVILGFSTDSYDLLGIVNPGKSMAIDLEKLNTFIKENIGTVSQKYPPYSSFRIKGKPLYWWSRNKKKVKIPEREVKVDSLNLIEVYEAEREKLEKKIVERTSAIKGDFRQTEIKKAWTEFFKKDKREKFDILKFRIECSGGYYVRSFANDLGNYLGTKACAYSIKRTRIGDFRMSSFKKTPTRII